METRGYTGDPHWVITRRPNYNTLEELDRFEEILSRALAKAAAAKDPEIREKLRRRVEVLTLYYKVTRLSCFPFLKSKEEMLAVVADVRRIATQQNIRYFHMWRPLEDYLEDCEKVIRKELPEENRVFPLVLE